MWDKSTWCIDLVPWKTLTCTSNALTKQRKWRQHTILRMLNKQDLCQKHRALESIRIRVGSETIRNWLEHAMCRCGHFWIRKTKLRIQKFPYSCGRGLNVDVQWEGKTGFLRAKPLKQITVFFTFRIDNETILPWVWSKFPRVWWRRSEGHRFDFFLEHWNSPLRMPQSCSQKCERSSGA